MSKPLAAKSAPPPKRAGRFFDRTLGMEVVKILPGEHHVSGEEIGIVTSGGFGPTVGKPVAMGYVAAAHAAPGTSIALIVRGRPLAARVAAMPFAPHRYKR